MKRSGVVVYFLHRDDFSRMLISEINYGEIINLIIERSAKFMDGSLMNIDYEVTKYRCW